MGAVGMELQSTLMPLAVNAFLTSEQSSGDDGAGAAASPLPELWDSGSSTVAAVNATNTFMCTIVHSSLKFHKSNNFEKRELFLFPMFSSPFLFLPPRLRPPSGLKFAKRLRKVEEERARNQQRQRDAEERETPTLALAGTWEAAGRRGWQFNCKQNANRKCN